MSNKKSIYFYINNLNKGGAERVIIQLAKGFSNKGYESTIITTFQGDNEYDFPKNVKRINLLEEQDTGNRFKRNILLVHKLRRLLKNKKTDILISFMLEANFRAILATIGLKTNCIVSVRNDPAKEYSSTLGRLVGKYILPLADGCVFQTNEAREWFPKKLQKKSRIIFNAVDDKFYNVTRNVEKNTVVTCGRLEEQKNHKMLIDAFELVVKSNPSARLLIYGEGLLREELHNIIIEKELSNNIKLCGNSNDIPEVLSRAEIFVLSSDYEGMPNALMEALVVGVPCISTDCPCGGPRMLINNKKNGVLIAPNDYLGLSAEILNILNNEELQEHYSKESKIKSLQYKPSLVLDSRCEYVESFT